MIESTCAASSWIPAHCFSQISPSRGQQSSAHSDGYELAETLRSLPGYEAPPMVAVTGYSMFDDRNRSLSAGFNEHVTKPIDLRPFLDLIEQL
jgi:CheY-like chemotaxis protein